MLILSRPFLDPFLNIAAEEYFVKNTEEAMCMVWRNSPSVIIGKHQNAFAEINHSFVEANRIPVIRRISGGGAVYHDLGNVNFSFIEKADRNNPVDFMKFTQIIIRFLSELGIEAHVNPRNSILIGDKKISGHAQHLFRDRVLHHGRLLFDTDLAKLNGCLEPEKKYSGKAPQSVRNEVANISDFLEKPMDVVSFADQLVEFLLLIHPGSGQYDISQTEMETINQLAISKYHMWEWNFGYSPAYEFNMAISSMNKTLEIGLKVENGTFVGVHFPIGEETGTLQSVFQKLIGKRHKLDEIDSFIHENKLSFELEGLDAVYLKQAFYK